MTFNNLIVKTFIYADYYNLPPVNSQFKLLTVFQLSVSNQKVTKMSNLVSDNIYYLYLVSKIRTDILKHIKYKYVIKCLKLLLLHR